MKVVANTSNIEYVDQYTARPGMVCVRDGKVFFVVSARSESAVMFVNVETGTALPQAGELRFELRPAATLTV